jgi:hypothetical protein
MIDATKSPVPAWQRNAIIVVLAVLVVVAGYMLWTKELHKSTSGSSGAPAAVHAILPTANPTTGNGSAVTIKTAPTTVPGGVPVSSRDPFGS